MEEGPLTRVQGRPPVTGRETCKAGNSDQRQNSTESLGSGRESKCHNQAVPSGLSV